MLQEIFKYYTTPCSEWAREFGYLKEVVSIESRYLRLKKNWEHHHNKCHAQVISFCEKNPSAKSIAIFGSGYLHEIPLSYLLEKMETIYLVDLVFPKKVRSLAKKNNKIVLIEKDLSGCLQGLSRGVLKISPIAIESDRQADIFVSANVLSQLPLLPTKWINKKKLAESREAIHFGFEIQKNHLRFLKYLSRPVLVFTDTQRIFKDASDNILHVEQSVQESQLPKSTNVWDWDIAPISEIAKDFAMTMKVKTYELFQNETL